MIPLHIGLAERGKLLALQNQHIEALRYYRQAMQHATTVMQSDPAQEASLDRRRALELCLRHYTQCALESLERMGAYDEVLATCERAQEHYDASPPRDDVARKDCGSFHERRGVVNLRRNQRKEATTQFEAAIAAAAPSKLPLSETLLRWLRSNLHLSKDRLEGELTRQHYWSVRADRVRNDWAQAVPGLGPDVSAWRHDG